MEKFRAVYVPTDSDTEGEAAMIVGTTLTDTITQILHGNDGILARVF